MSDLSLKFWISLRSGFIRFGGFGFCGGNGGWGYCRWGRFIRLVIRTFGLILQVIRRFYPTFCYLSGSALTVSDGSN